MLNEYHNSHNRQPLIFIATSCCKTSLIKIFWWHWENNTIFCCVFTFMFRFLPQCAHFHFMIWCVLVPCSRTGNLIRTDALFTISYLNLINLVSMFQSGECPFLSFNLPHFKFLQSSCDGLLNFCDAQQCQDVGFDHFGLFQEQDNFNFDVFAWYPFNCIFVWKLPTAPFTLAVFQTLALMTQIEKIFRFYVLYSRELNFSLCHMVCSSARDMQANEETNKLFSL